MRIGVWSLAHVHAPAYLSILSQRNDIEWLGITDKDAARGEAAAAKAGIPFEPDPAQLLAKVDAVVITSANADHRDMAIRAAQAGVHALVEKPIATTAADAEDMIQAFGSRGLVLATAFPCPFSPAFVDLLSTVRAGTLGKILGIKATNRGTMPGGFFIDLEKSGGGAVIDHTVHVADLVRRLTQSEVVAVQAEIGHGLFHENWDDSGLLMLDMADGSFASLDTSWSRPKSFPTWGDVTLKVIGEQGNATVDLFAQHVTIYPGESKPARWASWGSDMDALMISDFLSCVAQGTRPMSTGEDGLRALEVTLTAYASAESGQSVAMSEIGRDSD